MDNTAQKQKVTAPVSSLNKERVVAEVIRQSEPEPNIPSEVQNAGVEVVSERPKLDETHDQIGVKLPGEIAPVPTKPSGAVKLPIPEAQARADEKGKLSDFDIKEISEDHDSVLPSKRFLGKLVTKVLEKAKSIFKI